MQSGIIYQINGNDDEYSGALLVQYAIVSTQYTDIIKTHSRCFECMKL